MGPRKCQGFDDGDGNITPCVFSTNAQTAGSPAHGNFEGRCVWCNPAELQRRCGAQRLRKLLVCNLRRLYEINPDTEVMTMAASRLNDPWKHELLAKACPPTPPASAAPDEDCSSPQ